MTELNKHDEYCKSIVETLEEEYASNGDLYNYFMKEDIFDIKYTVDADKSYCGVRLMISCGGPNVYLDTYHHLVELYWGDEEGTWWIPNGIVEQINEYWEEMYNC